MGMKFLTFLTQLKPSYEDQVNFDPSILTPYKPPYNPPTPPCRVSVCGVNVSTTVDGDSVFGGAS